MSFKKIDRYSIRNFPKYFRVVALSTNSPEMTLQLSLFVAYLWNWMIHIISTAASHTKRLIHNQEKKSQLNPNKRGFVITKNSRKIHSTNKTQNTLPPDAHWVHFRLFWNINRIGFSSVESLICQISFKSVQWGDKSMNTGSFSLLESYLRLPITSFSQS